MNSVTITEKQADIIECSFIGIEVTGRKLAVTKESTNAVTDLANSYDEIANGKDLDSDRRADYLDDSVSLYKLVEKMKKKLAA